MATVAKTGRDSGMMILQKMRAVSPRVTVLVAQVIPLDPVDFDCPSCADNVVSFNAAIPDWAATESSAASPVIAVDQWTGFNLAEDTTDGVHPYPASGAQKIADRWYDALVPLL